MLAIESFLPRLKAVIAPVLETYHLQIYEINTLVDGEGNDILQVLIEFIPDSTNQVLDFDLLTKVNEAISAELDQLTDLFPNPYILEVASAGIEKPIRNDAELHQALEKYVYVEFKEPINGVNNTYATISGYNPETQQYEFTFFIKGKKQRCWATFAEISFIRHAVKF